MGFFREIGKRFKEPSTYAALAGGAALLHGTDAGAVVHTVLSTGLAVATGANPVMAVLGGLAALAGIFLPEKGNTP